ncbi:MAG TPA: tRNA (adenosine(37)-N6)-dimethylallyltransferase MiaA [Acidimicrobiales bacterium]|nr:tRNA (adenosine(37)-N6)-dimethylallyltransferase MiaA [Acidimicrobiales bacterium]
MNEGLGACACRQLALVGPTASGKSAVALEVARRARDIEIVSVDAMQVYRGMDIGTAKSTWAERTEVPHHLIDVAEPSENYAVARYQRDARAALDDIAARGKRALLVGGTGLYLRAIIDELDIPAQYPEARYELDNDRDTLALHARLARLDPVAASRMEPTNRRRIVRALEVTIGSGRPFSSYGPGLDTYRTAILPIVGLRMPRALLDARIDARYDAQLAGGFLDEVRELRAQTLSRTARQALGYKELLDHLAGMCTLDEAMALARARTRRFARRQDRWFRRDPRVRWIDVTENPMVAVDAVLGELSE